MAPSLDDLAGPTTAGNIRRAAANLITDAQIRTGHTTDQLATAAGVPLDTITAIEHSTHQPTLVELDTILIAIGLELRLRLDTFDDHDRTLDRLNAANPQRQADAETAVDDFTTRYASTAAPTHAPDQQDPSP
jgi:DNA-binding XRE family transcriptional regulator